MSYRALIRRNSDGKKVWCDYPYEWTDSSEFMWTQGNWGCDCNREINFCEAINEDEPTHKNENICLGRGAYSVLQIITDKGDVIYPDETDADDTCIPDEAFDFSNLKHGEIKIIPIIPHKWKQISCGGSPAEPTENVVVCENCGCEKDD